MADGFHDMHELTMHLDAMMFEAVTPLTETSPSGRQNDRFVLFREIRTQELQTMPKNTATELRDLRMASKSNLDRMHAHTRHGKWKYALMIFTIFAARGHKSRRLQKV